MSYEKKAARTRVAAALFLTIFGGSFFRIAQKSLALPDR